MGHAVVHFEIIGKDSETLQRYYSELFGWNVDGNNPLNYGVVQRAGNTNPEGIGIGGGIGPAFEGSNGHVTFYVEVPDVDAALAKAAELGGTRVFGPDEVPGMNLVLGQFTDPEGHLIGLMQAPA
jgi:predicted enzyme related to lactoylglutathione lyase